MGTPQKPVLPEAWSVYNMIHPVSNTVETDLLRSVFSANLEVQITLSVPSYPKHPTRKTDLWTQGEEVLHLPVIVEAAESSPAAATEASVRIRKFLSKENYMRAYVQYNAIMLMRILADNPGKSFTRNIDSKFVSTVKELLRDGRDMSVQQILRETLDNFVTSKENDETLTALREMWKKERNKASKHGNNNNSLVRTSGISKAKARP